MKRELVRTFFLLGVLSFPLAILQSHLPHPKPLSQLPPSLKLRAKPSQSVLYEPHSPINITSNADFSTQAAIENWPGNGSDGNPYVIDGLIIGPANRILVNIRDTNVHFQIQSCILNLGSTGIYFTRVRNGHISNITVTGSHNRGIELWEVEDSILSNSWITNNSEDGIYLRDSKNNVLSNNTATNNGLRGIELDTSENNLLANNTVINNQFSGILVWTCQKTILFSNTVSNNTVGILFWYSDYCLVSNNTIANNSQNGIEFSQESSTCRVIGNIIANNSVGLRIWLSRNHIIQFNNFQVNNGFQAFDGGQNNSFDNNYWNDWIGPDDDGDGIVDIPYSIEGGNFDMNPTVVPIYYVPSQLEVFFITPNGGEMFAGTLFIEWLILDLKGDDIIYTLSYSPDGGTTWTQLMNKLNTSFYSWDTTTVMDGSEYLIRVNASSSKGLTGNITSENTFTINNRHHLQPFLVLTPVGGETYFSFVTIQWTPAIDLFNHGVTYSVAYSADNGTSWSTLISNLTLTKYEWNSTSVADGWQYRIQVNASCESGAWQVATSDTFTVDNEPPNSISTEPIPFSKFIEALVDVLLILQSFGIIVILSWPLFVLAVVFVISRRLEG